jgi:ATP-dependent Clp protease ATP-binding subunit ClpA
MFEQYTEKARRAIFFSRYEASLLGSQQIEPEHILLGIVREDPDLIRRLMEPSRIPMDEIRDRIVQSAGTKEKIAASVALPLSPSTKAVLRQAADEASRLQHRTGAPSAGFVRRRRREFGGHSRRHRFEPRCDPGRFDSKFR